MRVALLHAYSAENSGDGLLVRATLDLVHAALGADVEVSVFASYPESFASLGLPAYRTKPGRLGYERGYVRHIRSLDETADLVVGVGGGYLRAPGGAASAKCALVMVPQLRAAASSRRPSIYLPQSVGPLTGAVGSEIRRRLAGVDSIYMRDDRSICELGLPNATRMPDLAILQMSDRGETREVDPVPVLNVRPFRGATLPASVADLRRRLPVVDGFVQSTVSSNNDIASVAAVEPRRTLSRDEFYAVSGDRPRRVVVAMRLHCALEALDAGHYVVHLAYERKGFGAFEDLGLGAFVHPVARFDPSGVTRQVAQLLADGAARQAYDAAVRRDVIHRREARAGLVERIREVASPSLPVQVLGRP